GFYADAHTKLVRIDKGDLVLFFPGQAHQCCTRAGEFWDELWFEFEGPAFDLLRETKLLNPRHPVHHTQNPEDWFRRFFQIIPPLHRREKTPAQVTISRFISVLTEVLADSAAPEEPPAPRDDWLNAACEM